MRDRVDADTTASFAETIAGQPSAVPNDIRDAVNALIALGYKPQEATRMVESVDSQGCSSEEIIRSALKTMVK
jgi:Holliday junction DNA helicase RuvA